VETGERRSEPRKRVFKGGSISFETVTGLGCVVRNLSPHGALIELSASVDLPDEFTLIIKPEMLKRTCRIVWRSKNLFGVRFGKPISQT
jgi:PilZ domain